MQTSLKNNATSILRILLVLGVCGLPEFLLPARARALDFHVDLTIGDDARAPLHAQSPDLPWRTIQHALATVQSAGGPHTIHVTAGIYAEALESGHAGIRLLGASGTVLVPPAGATGLYIDHADFVLENFTIQGGVHGIRANAADRLIVRGCRVSGASQNGLHLSNSNDTRVENSEFADHGSRGIFILNGQGAYLRNNLVTGNAEWGIEIDGGDAALLPPSTDHLVAFNTVADNGSSTTNGGIRFENATGEIRDNLIAGNTNKGIKVDSAPTLVHHNLLWDQNIPIDEASAAPPAVWATTAADPLFVGGGDYRVRPGSPALENGSGPVVTRDISGSILSDLSEDTGVADLGYHVAAAPSAGTPVPGTTPTPTPEPTPASGLEHFVDCASGDDSRSAPSARNPATPWATIRHAILAGGAHNIVTVHDGSCVLTGEIEVDRDGVTIRAANTGAVTIVAAAGSNAFTIQADDVVLEGLVIESPFRGVQAGHSDETHILEGLVLRSLEIHPPAGSSIAIDAITIKNARFVTVENNQIRGAGNRGIQLRFTSDAYVRNNLVTQGSATSDSFAIDFENNPNTTAEIPPLATGNIVAFNTVHGNRRGIRFNNAAGEIRDNIVTDNLTSGIRVSDPGISSLVHHNLSWNNGSTGANNWSLPSGFDFWASNLSLDPSFVDSAGDDYSLSELAAGQSADSPALGAGSAPISISDIDGSTRSDRVADSGRANLGYHAQASALGGGVEAIAAPDTALIHVDCSGGNDSRSRWEVARLWDGWATISRALTGAAAGDTIIVRDGTCLEALEIETADLRLQAENPLGAVIEAPSGLTAVRIEADRVSLANLVIRSDQEGIRAAAEDSDTSLSGILLSGLLVEKLPGAVAIATNGIRLSNTFDSIIDSCEIHDAALTGIAVLSKPVATTSGGGRSYLRNNLITGSGEWGIHIDSEAPAPVTTGHLIAFNTVYANGTTGGQGGLRLQNAVGEIRDNIIASNSGRGIKTDTAPLLLHHNLVYGNPVAYDTKISATPTAWANLARDPLFRDAPGGDFRLQQTASGDATTSSAVDAGSGVPFAAGISGSTRSDAATDTDLADLGRHQGTAAAVSIPAITDPPAEAGRTIFVNSAIGDDTYHFIEATDRERPWQTISRALRSTGAQPGDTVVVRAGTYNESVETNRDGVTILAEPGVVLQAGGLSGFFIENSDITIDGFRIEGALHGVRGSGAARLTLRRSTIIMPSGTGIKLTGSVDSILDSNTVEAAAGRAIHSTDSAGLYARNNLLLSSGTWAIHLDTADGAATVGDSLIAFNTINGSGTGGIRFENTTGTIRDNIVSASATIAIKTDTAPVDVHHNDLHDATLLFDQKSGEEARRWSNSTFAPLFVDAAGGDFRLKSVVAGDAQNSPLLDRGSEDAASMLVDISGSTTRDGADDIGRVDPGHHENAAPTPARPLVGPTYSISPGAGGTFHVDAAGDNARSTGEATAPGGAWRTISFAIGQLAPGDTLLVAAGDYAEAFSVPSDGVRIAGSGALGDTRLLPPADLVGIGLAGRTGVRIENLVIEGGAQSIRAETTSGLRIYRVASINAGTVGLQILDSTDAWIDSSIVTGAGAEGLLLRRSDRLHIRNNLVYGNDGWGISLDNDLNADPAPAVSTGNLLAFNTVHANGDGVRILGASGEVRDNIFTNHFDLGLYLAGPEIYEHHNTFAFNGRDRDRDFDYESIFAWAYTGRSPKYVDVDGVDGILGGSGWQDDDFSLARKSAGQAIDSPVIDSGSGLVAALAIDGSTSSDGMLDTGIADPGLHVGASAATSMPTPAPFDPTSLLSTYFVSSSWGDDGTESEPRTAATARDPATPWGSIRYAVARAEAGATIVVLPGIYSNSIHIERDDITIRAETPGTALIEPLIIADTFPEVEVGSDEGTTGFTIEGAGVTLDGLVIHGGTTGISALATASGLRIVNCVVYDAEGDGIRVQDASDITIEDSITSTNLFSGIKLRNVGAATVRNVLSYGNAEWGVTLDNSGSSDDNPPPLSTGNLVTSNTIAWNGVGNLRLDNSGGLVRDNLLTNTPGLGLKVEDSPATLLHNGLWDTTTETTRIEPANALFCDSCTGNIWADPLYLAPRGADRIFGSRGYHDDDFRLAQIGAGQTEQSAVVDAGSNEALLLGLVGTTATSGETDSGMADLGFHYGNGSRAPVAPTLRAANQAILYVDFSAGDDDRTRTEAALPATPWKTLAHALDNLVDGDTLVLAAGTWTEPLKIRQGGITILGAGSLGSTTLAPGKRRDAIRIRAADVEIRNLVIDGARRGISLYRRSDDIHLEDLVVVNTRREGIVVRGAARSTLESVTITGCGGTGLYASRASELLVRNAIITACRRGGMAVTRSSGTIEFSTLHAAGRVGLRIRTSGALTVRDMIITGHSGSGIHARYPSGEAPTIDHILLGANTVDLAPTDFPVGAGIQLATDPLYVDADGADGLLGGGGWADDLLFLSPGSPAMNSGSGDALARGVDTLSALGAGGLPDEGVADLGAHR